MSATIDPFTSLDDVPVDYWPVIVTKNVQGAAGCHEDQNGPRRVLEDGYVSYRDPVTTHWMQIRMFSDQLSSAVPHVVDLTTNKVFRDPIAQGTNLRAAIDRVTPRPQYTRSLTGAALLAHQIGRQTCEASQTARAGAIRTTIRKLKRERAPSNTRARKR